MQCITSSIDCSKTNTSNIPIPKDKEENVSYSPLHYTCSCGDFNLAEQLLSQGYNANIVDINGNGALHWAAKSGNVDLVDLLVEKHGAKMNSQNNAGWSPLHFSLKFGNDAISLYFLSKGCDPNIQDLQGVSPLHIACAVGNLQILDVLYKHGAWLEIEDEEGDTPLHYAVRENHINVIQWLLQHGADQNHPNSDMETPLDLVEEFGDGKMISIFEQFSTYMSTSLSSCISVSSDKSSRIGKLRVSSDSYWKDPGSFLGQSTDSSSIGYGW